MAVPSPTYLLQNIYDDIEGNSSLARSVITSGEKNWHDSLRCCAGLPIHHMDLYRITAVEQLARLQLADSWRTAVSLVEWPERLGSYLPVEHLSVTLQPVEEVRLGLLQEQTAAWQARNVVCSGHM